MIYQIVYKLGSRFRNPSLKGAFYFLKKSEKWTLKELEKYQLIKLKELVCFVYEHSQYYKHKFDEIHFNPKDLKTLKDIKKMPVLTKSDVLLSNKEVHANFYFKKKFKAVTSGSTGDSLAFFREEFADSFNRASIARGYSWHNLKLWDKNGYFWGYNFTIREKIKTWLLDKLQNRFRVFSYKEKEFVKFVKKLKKAKYIHGYSSMIYQTAKLINERKLPKPQNILMVKGTSEKIFKNYQEETIKAFGTKIISEYGATESGIIAFECPKGNMHINMEGVIVEVENDEILVTNLQMKSFPIIRYKLGDYIKLAPKDKICKCGKKHLIIEEVIGRIGNNVYGKSSIFPSLYFYYIFKNLDKSYGLKLTYQVIQEKKGELIFNISEKLLDKERKEVKKEITKYFSLDIDYIIHDESKISAQNEKRKSFISKID